MTQVNFVSAEMRNPGKDLPRVIHTAVPSVICKYYSFTGSNKGAFAAANLGYFTVLPWTVMSDSHTIGLVSCKS